MNKDFDPFSETLTPTLTLTLDLSWSLTTGIMSAENTSNRGKEQTTEQHDWHIQTGSGAEEITQQCDRQLEKAQLKRAEETPEHCDCWLEKA